jgi:Tol biopolymer transport system component
MNPERWRQVDELFRAVSQAEPGRRGALLAELAAGDEGLRREVEALLEASEAAGGFLDTKVFEAAAPLLAGRGQGLKPGQAFGRYRIVERVGAGGMGEVYLAEDARLKRKVALKLLPDFLTADPERVRRFEREAQAVAALSHPHIVTIHEVFEADDGLHCIVMEHVEGRTLRELLAGGPLRAGEALDVAVQVASALAAAHEAGVVHRDIKPENVMVRPDGYVKVLDFGLAKLTERPGAGGEQPTLIGPLTQSGVVMGTAHYMSPEQARGLKVDGRTDVWSLGVVLYEMLAGRPPFEGETMSDVLVSLLSKEPEPLSAHGTDAPAELQRIISKALAKRCEDRPASMGELLAELREARAEEEFRTRQELHLSEGGGGAPPNASGAAARERGGQGRGRALLWAAALTVAVSALGLGVYQYVRSGHAPAAPPTPKMERVTAHGRISLVALSPDGRYIAYAAGPPRQHSLWVMQTGTRNHTQIIPPAAEVIYWGLTFSPDGDYVYFVSNEGSSPWELHRVPTLGGTPKKLLSQIDSVVTFSPDGRRLAFVRGFLDQGVTHLVVANADGTGERVVATRRRPDFFMAIGIVKISWSPDGETIACPTGNTEIAPGNSMDVVAVSVRDGTERTLTRERWGSVQQVTWLRDGSGLVMTARDQEPSRMQVWHLSYPEGSARKLTNDSSNYLDSSLTADSSTIAAVQEERFSNVWVAPEGDAARARQVTENRLDGFRGLDWTPDGRIVYSSEASGNLDIWIMDADGGNQKRLTDNPGSDGWPSVTADGRHVVFASVRAGRSNIWRMDIDGGNPVRLTDGNGEHGPHCSPDGRWVYYISYSPGLTSGPLWKVPIDGGAPVLVTDEPTGQRAISPDGKLLAHTYVAQHENPTTGLKVVPVGGGRPVMQFQFELATPFSWTPDGRALAYADDRYLNIWARPLDGGPPRQLTYFKSDLTFFFAWSRDGKQLALARGTRTSDVVLITDFK